MFQNRQLVIATKHQKERVLAPLLEEALGVTCIVHPALDTDELGTFTGEVERTLDPVAAAREKCKRAMQLTGCDIAVASEGSFGPHPILFFTAADEEFLLLLDARHKIEIVVREISTHTNFNGREVTSEEELMAFAEEAGFPSHALILRHSNTSLEDVHKGITEKQQLMHLFTQLRATSHSVFVQTDMRAMHNPTRMQVIEQAAVKLIQKIQSLCPHCQMPGFDVVDVRKGLLCSLCGRPTDSALSLIYRCTHCAHTTETIYPQQKETEDPAYCNHCNP